VTKPVGILIPSLNRPQNLGPLIDNIHATAGHPHTLHFAVSDPESIAILTELGEHFITDDGDTWPNRVNALYHATDESRFYVGCGDDDWHYDGWLRTMLDCFTDGIEVVFAHCLHTMVITRRYIQEQSGCVDVPDVVIWPGYTHCYSEWEFGCVATMRHVVATCPIDTVEHHRHRASGTDCQLALAPYDATYKRGDDSLLADQAKFDQRSSAYFPGVRFT
jgi:hypothetical protein